MTTGGFPSKRLARVRDVLERHVDAGCVPGAVAVVARHGEVHIEATGNLGFEGAGSGTLGHQQHLGDVIAGYGTGVDLDVIRAWWSLRSLQAARWLMEHGFDPSSPGCEFDVLKSQL